MGFQLDEIEKLLESIFEGKLVALPKGNPLFPSSGELINQIEKNIVLSDNIRKSPNVFKIYFQDKFSINRDDLEEWKNFAQTLIWEYTQRKSYRLNGPIQLEVFFKKSNNRTVKIIPSHSASISGKTFKIKKSKDTSLNTINSTAAYLMLWDGEVYPLGRKIINIGRHTNNDLVIDNLRVSRKHAQIQRFENGYILIDLNSKIGTRVNKLLINKHRLSNGDLIELGDIPIIFNASLDEKKDKVGTKTELIDK